MVKQLQLLFPSWKIIVCPHPYRIRLDSCYLTVHYFKTRFMSEVKIGLGRSSWVIHDQKIVTGSDKQKCTKRKEIINIKIYNIMLKVSYLRSYKHGEHHLRKMKLLSCLYITILFNLFSYIN